MIALARAGEPEAQAVVERAILELQSRGAALPTELGAYNMDKIAGLLQPHLSSGPKRKDRLMRNTFIALAVEALVDGFGLLPTRKPRRGRPSASSIVAEAYSLEAGKGSIGENAVEAIWLGRRGAMPTVRLVGAFRSAWSF